MTTAAGRRRRRAAAGEFKRKILSQLTADLARINKRLPPISDRVKHPSVTGHT